MPQIPESRKYKPGPIAGYLHYLEAGGADYAAKACWPDLRSAAGSRNVNCSNNSLDGLLTPEGEPRSAWWVYKSYTDGVSSRVSSATSNPSLVALASRRGSAPETAQVLLGYFSYRDSPSRINAEVNMKHVSVLPFIQGANSVRVKIELIPDTLEDSTKGLKLISNDPAPVSNDSVQFVIPNFNVDEAYLVTISR